MSVSSCITIKDRTIQGHLELLLLAESKMVERIVESAVFPFGIAQHRAKVEKSLLLFSKLVERTWDTLFDYLSHLLIHYRCYES
jgi:hypothetical protein